jgi:hypothetical protein
MKYLLICLFLSSTVSSAEFTDAFVITVHDQKVRVTSPKNKIKLVSILVKNETFQDIRSEISSEKKVLKRFNLKAQSSRSVQVNIEKVKTLFYVSVAPPFQAVELKFSERPYEIPPKK